MLKKRKRDDAWAATKAKAAADAKAAAEKKSKEIFTRAEKYVKEYRDQVSVVANSRARLVQLPAVLGLPKNSRRRFVGGF